jgi:hypothetical protein
MKERCINVVSKLRYFSSSIIRQTAKQPGLESMCVWKKSRALDNLKQKEIRRKFKKIIIACSNLSIVVIFVLLLSYVYLLYLMFIYCKRMCICCTLMCICCTVCIAVLTLDAGLLARSQYPATSRQFFLGSLCLQANAEMVPKFPSCY